MFSTEAEYGSAIKAKGGVSASMLGMAALPRVQGTDAKEMTAGWRETGWHHLFGAVDAGN